MTGSAGFGGDGAARRPGRRRRPTPADAHLLTGAHALHALPEVERAAFERHLRSCPECRREVHEFAGAAGRLAAAETAPAPLRLRAAVLAEIATTARRPAPGRWRPGVRWGGSVLAAAVVVALVLHPTAPRPGPVAAPDERTAVSVVLEAPDATSVSSTPAPGVAGSTLVLVSRSRAQVAVLAAGLPALDGAHVYQVWLIGPGGARSAGLLRPGVAGRMRPLLAPLPPDTNRVGITVEPAGGSPGPTTPATTMIPL